MGICRTLSVLGTMTGSRVNFYDTRQEIGITQTWNFDTWQRILGKAFALGMMGVMTYNRANNYDTKQEIGTAQTNNYDTRQEIGVLTLYNYDTRQEIGISVYYDYDTRQEFEDPTKITFVSQEFEVFIFEEDWITVSSESGYIELLNYHGIGSLPTITLTLATTYSDSPTLRIYNGGSYKDIVLEDIGASDSPLVINSNERYGKKNNKYFFPSAKKFVWGRGSISVPMFPTINNNEFFSVEFRNNGARVAIPISLYYKTHEIPVQIMRFRDSVSLQNVLNQVDISKMYYNSPVRSKKTISDEVSIEFGRNIITDNIDQIVNSTKTYRIEVVGINEDDGTQKIYRIGNVTFNNLSINIPEADLVTDKISGVGVWL